MAKKKTKTKSSVKPADFFLIPTYSVRKNQLIENDNIADGKYKCCACGKRFKSLERNFPYSQSVFFRGNNNRLPICNTCIDNFTSQYAELFESQDKAIKRIALHWDMYFSDSLLNSSRKTNATNSRVKNYIKNCNLTQNAGKTYDTYLQEQENNAIESLEELEELKSKGKATVPYASIERWGIGCFNDTDYKILDDHYKMLKKQNPNCDNNQEIFIKDLCYIKAQQMKAMKNGNFDDFKSSTQLYRETFKQAGLKTVQETDSSNEDVLGVTLAAISQYAPEEYYKDKKLYKDFDGIGSYISRFLLRPMKNLVTGSTDRDEEYCVRDGNDDE